MIYSCSDRCCTLHVEPYTPPRRQRYRSSKKRQKAGVFIYDPNLSKALLVQSRGHLWGPPKGTKDENESDEDCAIREVNEETGINLRKTRLGKHIKIRNRATYFYTEMDACNVNVQKHIHGNDANGIAWIGTECLLKLIKSGKINLNQHCIFAFQKFLGMRYPKRPQQYSM
jgi:ADP-ribose pyrophosphatase YjhB (NUDIX family)